MPGHKDPASSQNIGKFHILGRLWNKWWAEKGEDAAPSQLN